MAAALSALLPVAPILLGIFLFAFFFRQRISSLSLAFTAKEVERRSDFFKRYPEHRSELVTAAVFLDRGLFGNESLELAEKHVSLWDKRLENFSVELFPSPRLLGGLFLFVALFGVHHDMSQERHHSLPDRVSSHLVRSFQVQMPFANASWELKEGPLSGLQGSKIRLTAPATGLWQPYVFLQTGDSSWVKKACDKNCEFVLVDRGRFAVGSLLQRSPLFPMQLVPDEDPRAVIFVEEAGELIPSATLNILNKREINLSLLASDDIRLTKLRLVKEFEGQEKELKSWKPFSTRFRESYRLDLAEWQGGVHSVFLEASDYSKTIRSAPLTIFFADEEFLRQQRIASIQSLLDEWVHVLADLLESKEDARVHPGLGDRLQQIVYPEDLEESLFSVFVAELRRLGAEIQESVVVRQRLSDLGGFIEKVEDKILYGLSLLFQERSGDVQGAKEGVQAAQQDLARLLEEMRKGAEVGSEELQAAFDRLQQQLQELQEKMRNLPRGPQDDLINREALDEQLAESEKMEDRIAEIQRKLAEGQSEEALRELESLINQLNILTKEIENSLDQWQQNLNAGAMQSSERFESQLEELRKKQEEIAERTEQLEENRQEQKRAAASPEEMEQVREEVTRSFEDLAREQAELFQEFNEISRNFQNSIEGTEWEQVFNNSQAQELEEQISGKMQESNRLLNLRNAPDASNEQREAAELLRQAAEQQQQTRQQVQRQSQQMQGRGEGSGRLDSERMEVIESEGQGDRERRRRIMNSLRQRVDEQYQESHERYFEELLQR